MPPSSPTFLLPLFISYTYYYPIQATPPLPCSEAPWSTHTDGVVLSDDGEARWDRYCSNFTQQFGCRYKNLCCWDTVNLKCIPSNGDLDPITGSIGIECPGLTQTSCGQEPHDVCWWDATNVACRRKCPATWDVDAYCLALTEGTPTNFPTAPLTPTTIRPTLQPTTTLAPVSPTGTPTTRPTPKQKQPTSFPTSTSPSRKPTLLPTSPFTSPSPHPTMKPTDRPTFQHPTYSPSHAPTTSVLQNNATARPTTRAPAPAIPTTLPTMQPTTMTVNEQDLNAWTMLYDNMGGVGWTHCKENRASPCTCDFELVANVVIKCSTSTRLRRRQLVLLRRELVDELRITQVNLPHNNLTGTIPAQALDSMTALTKLDLSANPGLVIVQGQPCVKVDRCHVSNVTCLLPDGISTCTSATPAAAQDNTDVILIVVFVSLASVCFCIVIVLGLMRRKRDSNGRSPHTSAATQPSKLSTCSLPACSLPTCCCTCHRPARVPRPPPAASGSAPSSSIFNRTHRNNGGDRGSDASTAMDLAITLTPDELDRVKPATGETHFSLLASESASSRNLHANPHLTSAKADALLLDQKAKQNASTVEQLLTNLGLEEHWPRIQEDGRFTEINRLVGVTEQDLSRLGFDKMGERLKLMRALELRKSPGGVDLIFAS